MLSLITYSNCRISRLSAWVLSTNVMLRADNKPLGFTVALGFSISTVISLLPSYNRCNCLEKASFQFSNFDTHRFSSY